MQLRRLKGKICPYIRNLNGRLFDLLHLPATDTPDFSSQQSRCPRTRERCVFLRQIFRSTRRGVKNSTEKEKKKIIQKFTFSQQPLPRHFGVVSFLSSYLDAAGKKKNSHHVDLTANGSFFCAIQGGKNRRRGTKENDDQRRELTFKEDGQEYAQVVKMLGNGRLEAMCFDGSKRLANVR